MKILFLLTVTLISTQVYGKHFNHPGQKRWKLKDNHNKKHVKAQDLDPWKIGDGENWKHVDHSSWLKIIGGDVAKYGEYPFVLALEYRGDLFCGSSAIGDYWVLTAGHCLFFAEPENIKVRAGSLEPGKNGTLHEVAEIMTHPKFDMRIDLDNDIGLIKLKDPLTSNPYVKYVGLPDQGEPSPIGSRLVVAGWGCTKPYMEGGTSPVLKKAYADVLEPTKCEEHPMMTGPQAVSNNMICAMQEGHTAYKGDSGGPLFEQKDGKMKQIGVVSWGDYLGHQSIPTVYTKVSQFRLWIYLKTNI